MSAASIIVKVFAGRDTPDPWLRQFPGGVPEWGVCRFVFDREARAYDWLVVYDDLPGCAGERRSLRAEPLACPAARTILVTSEPSSVKVYGADYCAQFGIVLTSTEPWAIRHPHVVRGQCGLRWFYGFGGARALGYDELKATPPPPKPRAVSTVASPKRQRHTVHHARYAFTQRLQAALPELEVYGRGIRPMADKAEALDPFRCHVAVENHICAHHWTEKLADPFLGFCLPLYCGCPNAADYFPPESFVPIDIADFDGALATIRAALAPEAYAKRLPAIAEARRRVLDEYNFFAVIERIIRTDPRPAAGGSAPGGAIYSRHALRHHRPLTSLRFLAEKFWQRAAHGRARQAPR